MRVTGIRLEALRVVTSPALGGRHRESKEELISDRPGKGQEKLRSRVFQLRHRDRNPMDCCGQQECHRGWLRTIRKDLEAGKIASG